MKYMGFEISNDGKTEWRNNGGVVERRALYAAYQWETVAETPDTPHNAAELKAFCESCGFGYEAPNG